MGVNLKQANQERAEKWRADDTLPDGTYTFVLADRDMKPSGNGNPMIVLDWRVDDGQWKGATVKDYATFTEKALFRVTDILDAIGVEIPDKSFDSMLELREWVYGWLVAGKTRLKGVTRREAYIGNEGDARVGVKIKSYAPADDSAQKKKSDVPDAGAEDFKHEKPKPDDDDKVPF